MRAPGLSIKQVQNTPPLSPVRGDVAALIGYAARGPRGYPVRLGSWRDFVDVFGEPYGFGHLGTAIKGFFENGGQTCYAVRVTDDSAQAASLTVQGRTTGEGDPAETVAGAVQWTFSPAFKQSTATALDREVLDRLGSPPPSLNGPLLLPNPGRWGNELALSIRDSRRAVTHLLPGAHAGQTSQAANLDGLEATSLVRLSQPDHAGAGSLLLWVQAVDRIRGLVEWPVELDEAITSEGVPAGFDLDQAIVLETVDVTLELWLADRRLEQFPHLSLHPQHSRYLARTINRESRWLQVQRTLGPAAVAAMGGAAAPPATDIRFWPQTLTLERFRGGRDGLGQVDGENFLNPLNALEPIPDVALLAAPDLVLKAEAEQQPPPPLVETMDCSRLEHPPEGVIRGQVVNASSGSEEPVYNVAVYASNGRQAVTDLEGHFTLTQLPLAVVSLWFQRRGFVATEVLAQATTATGQNTATFYLEERQLPPDQSPDSIHRVQSTMVNQGERGLYRIALLDAPDPTMDVQGIQGWRARFDSGHGALYYPWLMVETGGGLSPAPPCGHLAGVFARAEREHGIHRAPANIALRSCKGLTQVVEDSRHGPLNAQGINVVRLLAGRGIHPFGARSLASAPEWRFINVRRLVNTLEQTLEQQLQWAVFEPNSAALREAVRFTLLNLLNRLWRQGALAGESADQAFRVKVDSDNNPARLRDQGRFLAEIQVAPSVPFEFITLRLGRTLDALEVQETAP